MIPTVSDDNDRTGAPPVRCKGGEAPVCALRRRSDCQNANVKKSLYHLDSVRGLSIMIVNDVHVEVNE